MRKVERVVEDAITAITDRSKAIEMGYALGIGILGTAFLAFALGSLLGLPGVFIAFSIPCFILSALEISQFLIKF